MSYAQNLDIPQNTIAAFCERHHIRKMALFGSILRDDFRPDSDIDVLVEFEPDKIPGWEIVAMQDELSAILKRPVDFRTPQELSRYFRQQVINTAETIYERT